MSNPCVSFRVSETDLNRLRELERLSGRSRGELLRQNLALAQRNAKVEYDRAWHLGWQDGYAKGKANGVSEGQKWGLSEGAYRLRIPCSNCGKDLEVDFADTKFGPLYWRCVREVLTGIHHSRCP